MQQSRRARRHKAFLNDDASFSISGFLREPDLGFEKYKKLLKQFRNVGMIEKGRTFSDIKVLVSGNTAWATLRDRFVRKMNNSKGINVDYHDAFTLTKRDGRWRIHHIVQTEQNVKAVARYSIMFGNGLRLETYLPSYLAKAATGGIALPEMFTQIVDPVYPEAARAAGMSGEVVFLAAIDRDGSISHAIRRMGNPILAGAAASAMRQWKAKPMPGGIGSTALPVQLVFHPNGSVDLAQTQPSLGVGRLNLSRRLRSL